ncbi:MAG: hypothetical protein ACOX65_11530, partial [Anaerotruncus rubiinfantis]
VPFLDKQERNSGRAKGARTPGARRAQEFRAREGRKNSGRAKGAILRMTFFEDFLGQIRKLKPSLGHHKF